MTSGVLEKLQQIPAIIASVTDYEPYARERLTEQAWAYVSGGAADEVTLRDNLAAFRRLALRPRVLQDLAGGNTQLSLFGQTFLHPILLAPVAFQALAHPEAERASALGASAMQAGMVVSTQASTLLEDIAATASSPLWFQLYIQPDRDFTRDLVARAERAGYQALVVTVDAPVNGLRNREQRSGFAFPSGIEAVNLRGMRSLPPQRGAAGAQILLGSELLNHAPVWRDLAWLKSLTRLPVLVKGITHADDAARAIAEGMDGIIVSNHGGRVLDGMPAALDVLPEVMDAVADRVPVLMDGGIRRGSDVFKALALGAKAVLVGRPYIFGLASAGATGVSHVLYLLRAELEVTMALAGCRDLAAISPECLRRAPTASIPSS